MGMIAICSWLSGATLGIRFRVAVLLPATILGLVLIAVGAGLKSSTISWASTSAVIFAAALQLGYLCGVLARLWLASAPLRSHRRLRSRGSEADADSEVARGAVDRELLHAAD